MGIFKTLLQLITVTQLMQLFNRHSVFCWKFVFLLDNAFRYFRFLGKFANLNFVLFAAGNGAAKIRKQLIVTFYE